MQQTCKRCGRDDYFNFDVPDDLWAKIVPQPLRQRVVCLSCFDELALEARVPYASELRFVCFAGHAATFTFDVSEARDNAIAADQS